jgi:hypothetical protein
MGLIIVLILCIIFLGIPLLLTTINILNLFKKHPIKENLCDKCTMILGSIYSIILLLTILKGKDYQEPLVHAGTDSSIHSPIASWHLPTIAFIMLISVVGFLILQSLKDKLPPLIAAICLSFIYIGNLLGLFYAIQLSNNLTATLELPGAVFFAILFPINYFLCSIRLIKKTIKTQIDYINSQGFKYNNFIISKCKKLLSSSTGWLIFTFILMVPVLCIILIILILFGQQPDAIIKAFTETSDWTLSKQISPPPIEYDGHYLCTVSLRGHKELVKPTRYGIRHKNKIVVNRQLCVANAFEDYIKEKLPKSHHFIRYIYDKYGYPLSNHIDTSIKADVVYILMKPLEYFFVIFLYTFDKNPENRIATQYT